MIVPPHGSAKLTLQVEVGNPGPFEAGVTIYVDDGGPRPLRFAVKGEAVQPDQP